MTLNANGPWEGLTLSGGRYQRLQTIGVGGMGYVYRAVDRNLKTDVVLKAPRDHLADSAVDADRFEHEIGALVKLSFPHIVPVIDVGRHEGTPYAVMRFLPGGNLASRVRVDSAGNAVPISVAGLKSWLPSIVKALDFMHRSRFVHRDVKPANILFDDHDQAYLSDFGIIQAVGAAADEDARAAGNQVILGTVDYMAPELLLGQPFDGRADQYALAVSLFELLSGRLPYDAGTIEAVIDGHLNRQPPRLADLCTNLSPAVSEAVARALAKDPADRFPTCVDFARALFNMAPQRATERTTIPAVPPNTDVGSTASIRRAPAATVRDTAPLTPPVPRASPPRAPKTAPPRKSNRAAAALIGAAVLAALAAIGFRFAGETTESKEPGRAANTLPRKIGEWKQRAKDVEADLIVDGGPLLKSPAYSDAAELETQLAAAAQERLATVSKRLDDLQADLGKMATSLDERSKQTAQRRAAVGTRPDAQSVEAERAIADEERALQDQESQLLSAAKQLKTLREASQSLRGTYDPATVAELAILRDLESIAAANQTPEISTATFDRAVELLHARNAKLAARALNVLARSKDPRGVDDAVTRFDLVPAEQQAELVWSLLVSSQYDSIAAALSQLQRRKDIFDRLDRNALLTLIEEKPATYQSIFPYVADRCRTGDERFRLARVQVQIMKDVWAGEMEASCKNGLLQDRVADLIGEIIVKRRTAAYGLTERLLTEHRRLDLTAISPDALAPLDSESPKLAGLLMEYWILRGNAAQRRKALEAYSHDDTELVSLRLRERLAVEGATAPAELANDLLPRDAARFADLAEHLLSNARNLTAKTVAYRNATPTLLARPAARNALFALAWQDENEGRSWVMHELLGTDFAKRFQAAEAERDRQLQRLQQIVPILSGKLVSESGSASLKTFGLQIAGTEIARLPQDAAPAAWSPEGEAALNLSELVKIVEVARKSAPEPYRPTIDAFSRYLNDLSETNRIAHEIGHIYDVTVVQQLPGALRAMKIKTVKSWDFRFAESLLEVFRRENDRYRTLSVALTKSRDVLPWRGPLP